MRTIRVCLALLALAMFTEVMMPPISRGADKAQLDDLAQKLKEPASRTKAIADAVALGKEGKILARALCEAACDKKLARRRSRRSRPWSPNCRSWPRRWRSAAGGRRRCDK